MLRWSYLQEQIPKIFTLSFYFKRFPTEIYRLNTFTISIGIKVMKNTTHRRSISNHHKGCITRYISSIIIGYACILLWDDVKNSNWNRRHADTMFSPRRIRENSTQIKENKRHTKQTTHKNRADTDPK